MLEPRFLKSGQVSRLADADAGPLMAVSECWCVGMKKPRGTFGDVVTRCLVDLGWDG